MFGPLRIAFRLLRWLQLVAMAGAVGFAVGTYRQLGHAHRTWGVDPAEAARSLPGDELVPDAVMSETRGIDIDAAPKDVWPWLVQMGYGRAGWYSHDQVDMAGASAETILDEFQELQEGDRLPTHPGGGFEARIIRPGETMVLYLDTDLVQESAEGVTTPIGLRAAGVIGDMAMPDFRSTWAFVLEPAPGGRTRLVERLRMWVGDSGGLQRVAMPFMGLGVFVMTRKHMLGLRARAERTVAAGSASPPKR